MSHQVFISFSSKDKKFAEKIYDRLVKHGISCWMSSRNIPPGGDYQGCIVDAINQAEIVVLVFSAQANSAYSDENRHQFQSNVGHYFQRKPCHLFRLNHSQSFHSKVGH